MLNINRTRTQARNPRSLPLGGMDYTDPKKKSNVIGKVLVAAGLIAFCVVMMKQSPKFNTPSHFSLREPGVTHVLVTGGAGYIGSHAVLRLLKDSYRVTIVDNLSRGNLAAVKILQQLFPEPGRLQFIYADLGDANAVNKFFIDNAFDAVMHFAAVAYVGESTLDPLKWPNLYDFGGHGCNETLEYSVKASTNEYIGERIVFLTCVDEGIWSMGFSFYVISDRNYEQF